MTTSSITAALPGTASSTSRGQSCPSACAIGHIGPDQRDLVLAERMVFTSSSGGEPVGLSFIEPKTVDDLIRRREMIKLWMDRTCGMFGRSPDFLNVMLTGLAAAAPEFGKSDKRFADHIRDYHVHSR